MSAETLQNLVFVVVTVLSFATGWLCCREHQQQATADWLKAVRERPPQPFITVYFPPETWKLPHIRRMVGGTWTYADVDRAAAGDGELGVHDGVRCVVTRQLPTD